MAISQCLLTSHPPCRSSLLFGGGHCGSAAPETRSVQTVKLCCQVLRGWVCWRLLM